MFCHIFHPYLHFGKWIVIKTHKFLAEFGRYKYINFLKILSHKIVREKSFYDLCLSIEETYAALKLCKVGNLKEKYVS
jgi:hypothetical protein